MFSKRINVALIVLFGLLLVGSIYSTRYLSFVYDFQAFYPKDSKIVQFYEFFSDQFEPSDNFVMIGVKRSKGSVFDSTFLSQVDQLVTEASDSVPYVLDVQSITNIQRPVVAAGVVAQVPVVHLRQPSRYPSDSSKITGDPRVMNRFVSADMTSLAVLLKTPHEMTLRETYKLQEGLDNLVKRFQFDEEFVAGRFYYQAVFSKHSKYEFLLYTGFAAVIMFLILALLFRRVWGVVLSATTVLVGLGLFIGFLGIQHMELDPMANLFPVLMVIVGISDVIHIMSKYIDEHGKGIGRQRAIRITVREIGMATFLTSATTAIGFASLLTSDIPPMRSFGLLAATGVLLTYVTVILLAPAFLSLFDIRKIIKKRLKKGKSIWDKAMQWTYLYTWRNQRTITIGAVFFVLFCLVGIFQIGTDIHMRGSFLPSGRLLSDFDFIETEFGGVRNIDIAILPADSMKATNPEVLRETDSLEKYLSTIPALKSPLSPTTFYKTLNQAQHGDNPEFYRLPKSEPEYRRIDRLMNRAPNSIFNVLLSPDKHFGRLTMKYPDIGSDSGRVLRKQINSWIDRNLDTSTVKFEITGTTEIFDKNNDNVRTSMMQGFGLAFLLVSLLMALLFRNLKMLFISLIPNIIPLLFAGALLGYLGIELDASTSIIFALAFGIAVDDTIHFLSKFKLELSKGKYVREAIRYTYKESGKAICLTTVILVLGFGILITSAYPPTHYIGLLLSAVLVTALLADLFVTPVLIYMLMGSGVRSKDQNPAED